jgi:hypothetical protein
MTEFYSWRLVMKAGATPWTEVTKERFEEFKKHNLFGPGITPGTYFEGRIIAMTDGTVTHVK